jgi:hypothetical protein
MRPIDTYDDWKLASPDEDDEQHERDVTDQDGWNDPDYDDRYEY